MMILLTCMTRFIFLNRLFSTPAKYLLKTSVFYIICALSKVARAAKGFPKATTVRASRLFRFLQRPGLPEANTSLLDVRLAFQSIKGEHQGSNLFGVSIAPDWRSALKSQLLIGMIVMATARILDFLKTQKPEGPCLIVDLEVVEANYKAFARTMPGTKIYYAVKANPSPEVLSLLARLGSCFDTASVAEIDMALAAGATPDRISFGNTIKKERDVAAAHARGIDLFAVDSDEEVEKGRPRRSWCPRVLPHPRQWRRC